MRKIIGLLGLCFLLAFVLRWFLLPSHLFFGPEQGSDFWQIQKIARGNPVLIGAKTDFDGVFHGPVYYSLAAIPYWLTSGNPLAVALFFALLQSLGVFAAYALAKEISGSSRTGMWAAVLYAVSFGAVVYSRWLSQQPLVIPLSFLFLFFVFRFLRGSPRALVGAAATAALLGQVQFINFLFVPVFLLVLGFWKRKSIRYPGARIAVAALLTFAVFGLANFVVFDLRHEFLIRRAFFAALTGGTHAAAPWIVSFREAFSGVLRWIGTFSGLPAAAGGLLVLAFFLQSFSSSSVRIREAGAILITWMLLPAVILFFSRRGVLDQLYSLIAPAVIVGLALAAGRYRRGILVVAMLVALNLWQAGENLPHNRQVFFQAPQPDVRYSDQQKVIDEVYRRAGDQTFEIQAHTIPYAWQDGWQYLFWFRGTTRYAGKMPLPSGGYRMFVIIQNDPANATFVENWYRDTVSTWGRLADTFVIGAYTVEERLMFE